MVPLPPPTDAAHPGNIPWDPQDLRRLIIRDRADHLGGTDLRLRPNDTDRDQDIQPGLFFQQAGIRGGFLTDEQNGGGRRSGGSVPGIP